MPASPLPDSLRETLDVFDERSHGEPLTTNEVADGLELGRRSVYARLERLVDRGHVETKKVGARGRVWWRPAPAVTDRASTGPGDRPVVSGSIEDVLDLAEIGVFVIDSEFDVAWIDATAERYFDLDRDAVVGTSTFEVVREQLEPVVAEPDAFAETVLATSENDTVSATFEFRITAGEGRAERWVERRSKPIESGRFAGGRVEVYYDVTERVERERKLAESERRNRTLVDNFPNGVITLFEADLRHTLAGGELLDILDFSVDEIEGKTIREIFPPDMADEIEPHFHAVFDGEASEFEVEAGQRTREFRTIPIWGDDGEIVTGLGMSQDVTDRVERQRELERQRERLRALNELNGVVREITAAVIEQSTREEIEETVCERLAETDSYQFAWIGDLDARTRTMDLRAEAGVEGYFDDVTDSVDLDDPATFPPSIRAIQTRETQFANDVLNDETLERWHDHVREYGFRSSASIPIRHEHSVYGVLNVYADRPDAFTDDERAVIGQLGDVVGQAIAAVERKRALMSDEVVTLQLEIADAFDILDVPESVDGKISLDGAVPIGEETYLVYGSAMGNAIEAVESIVEGDALPHWESVTVVGIEDDVTRFELRQTEPPVLSTVASHGGYVREARFEAGSYHMSIHLPPGTNVHTVLDSIQRAYPMIELITQRQLTRDRQSTTQFKGDLLSSLTDRQRSAIEAAYHSGYFSWPRESTGEHVAGSLGVTPSTFHYHLRKAENKLVAHLFDQSTASE